MREMLRCAAVPRLFFLTRRVVGLRNFSTAEDFEAAQKNIQKLSLNYDVGVKLKLYGLYKQGNVGDANDNRPGVIDFAGRAKYDAWKKYAGLSKVDAQKKYIELVNSLLKDTGTGKIAAVGDTSTASTLGLDTAKDGKVFRITLNRPDKFNAITWEMYDALSSAMENASKDLETSLTVITGAGDYYCSGNDLKNFAVNSPTDMKLMAERGGTVLERFVRVFIEHEKPLVVLVNGPAIGISVTVMALADIVIASDKATFHTPFSSLGQSPEGCSSYTFPLLMGTSKASEVLLFGKKLTAQEAMERNLVARVVPNAQFDKETRRLVAEYAKLPPESLRMNKQLMRGVHLEQLRRTNLTEIDLLKQRWLSEECIQALMKFFNRKNN